MHFEQFYLGCLAHASYLLVSDGEAVVVDPQRDIDFYLQAAKQHNATIRHIFETHLHADFVSGHQELAARTGARIYIGPNSQATVPHVQVRDGFQLRVGTVKISVLETPGHTPESICLVITDEESSSEPWAVLTGDTLFVGDVGRPDLSTAFTAPALAGMLYDSLHTKLLTLPDHVVVYPGHGAGSLCGRNLGTSRSTTIRTERLTNYALQIKTREEFIQQLTSNLPPRPQYFPQDAQINRAGAPSLADLPELRPIAAKELKTLLDNGAVAIDVRQGDEFAAGHVPGSINISLSGQFATWAGTLVDLKAQPVLIGDSPKQLSEARMRLARIGMDEERGYLQGGVNAWMEAGYELSSVPQISVGDLRGRLESQPFQVLDVRRKPEWQTGHIEGATNEPLDEFGVSLPEMNRQAPVAVICKSGYRSMIASSILQQAGFKNVINVIGGFDAWRNEGLPVAREEVLAA
ncbi:MAG TPA: MBL fold metallo-hydrolase [Terriglobales bacterium]|nr:MBL fold metallo-hydrolase [Terriglobales bacterium]